MDPSKVTFSGIPFSGIPFNGIPFSTFINNLCDVINCSSFLPVALSFKPELGIDSVLTGVWLIL
jgi:hypothetical protein